MISKDPNAPIGVFDSGLGGLTVLKSCIEAMPNEKFIYLGDTARTPYGSKAHETICRYALDCTEFLAGHDVKFIVIACNTVSAHALPEIHARYDCPIVSTVEPAVDAALKATRTHRIGVIGTKATIGSGVYQQAILAASPEATVIAKACPFFVPLVEEGMVEGEIVDKVVELYLEEFKGVDSLILGCTHYPLLSEAIQAYLGPEVALVTCSDSMAEVVKQRLVSDELVAHSDEPSVAYFATDAAERFNQLATCLVGLRDVESTHIDL